MTNMKTLFWALFWLSSHLYHCIIAEMYHCIIVQAGTTFVSLYHCRNVSLYHCNIVSLLRLSSHLYHYRATRRHPAYHSITQYPLKQIGGGAGAKNAPNISSAKIPGGFWSIFLAFVTRVTCVSTTRITAQKYHRIQESYWTFHLKICQTVKNEKIF